MTAFAVALSVIVTLSLGTYGWLQLEAVATHPTPLLEALYRATLAFGGDDSYYGVTFSENPALFAARTLGPLTTIAAVAGVVYAIGRDALTRARALRRRGHHVLVGASPFSLMLAERAAAARGVALTVIDVQQRTQALEQIVERRSTVLLPLIDGPPDRLKRLMGQMPSKITFGDDDTSLNFERAHALGIDAARSDVLIRIEDGSVARDLELLEPGLRNAEVFSAGETIARALVTDMDLPTLAQLRGQGRVHVGLIGFGRIGLAVAHEIALRGHRTDGDGPRITVFDCDTDAARSRMAAELPGLGDALEIDFVALDARGCGTEAGLAVVSDAEARAAFTALVVATGDDARNLGIGIRLRQAQESRLVLKAPIFVRNDAKSCIGPEPFSDLTAGLTLFGGRIPRREDAELERELVRLARDLHRLWLESQPAETRASASWDKLGYAQRRPSYRAAYSAIEILRSAGMSPPLGHGLAGLRADPAAMSRILSDRALIERLSRNEHDRWIAERQLDGWQQSPDGLRDDEKKRHHLMIDWQEMTAPDERSKDRRIVEGVLSRCAERALAAPRSPAWRRRVRVGVIGPMTDPGDAITAQAWPGLRRWVWDELGLPMRSVTIDILTPNAPGFDRSGATALATAHMRELGRPARVIAFNAARPVLLDRRAASRTPRDEAGMQSASLRAAAGAFLQIDMRPPGQSDSEIDTDRDAFLTQSRLSAERIDRVADVVVFCLAGAGPETHRALDRRRAAGGAVITLGDD